MDSCSSIKLPDENNEDNKNNFKGKNKIEDNKNENDQITSIKQSCKQEEKDNFVKSIRLIKNICFNILRQETSFFY